MEPELGQIKMGALIVGLFMCLILLIIDPSLFIPGLLVYGTLIIGLFLALEVFPDMMDTSIIGFACLGIGFVITLLFVIAPGSWINKFYFLATEGISVAIIAIWLFWFWFTGRSAPQTGKESYINQVALVISPIYPGMLGKVRFQGAIWNAACNGDFTLLENEYCRIVAVDGLTLWVVTIDKSSY
ncbi:MAG: NfeD family protein [Promethearchaeota archaeon]